MTPIQKIASDLSYEVLLKRIREGEQNPKPLRPSQHALPKPMHFSPSATEQSK